MYKPQHVLEFLIVCIHLQDKTYKYHDLYQPQHVYIPSGNPGHVVIYANHCIYMFYRVGVCTHKQDNTYKYNNLNKSQHLLDFLIVYEHLQDKTDKYYEF